ncbi:MAG TPA: hypothetical protein VN699_20515 [Pirellulales bacterium]|nr:hypothetical protein [Pirellulales bacterium]
MSHSLRNLSAALAVVLATAALAQAASLTQGLDKQGKPDLKSAGPLAFGPDGVLFVGDPQGAAIFAIDTGDRSEKSSRGPLNVQKLDEQAAALLGTTPDKLLFNDLAVNPASGAAYLSVSRGKGPDASPVLLRVDTTGKLSELSLDDVKYAKAALPNAPDPSAKDRRGNSQRQESITEVAYIDGRVLVAGLSNEEFASNLRSIPFPFTEADAGASVEIYHGAHGKFETASPVRTFTTYGIGGQDYLLAAYTCTPLVKIPLADLTPGKKVKGKTIAELGNRNRPLDMVVYKKDGRDWLLMANNSRGVMKIPTDGFDKAEGITKPVSDKAGINYQTIEGFKGVQHLDKYDADRALLLVRNDAGQLNLQTVELP